MKPSVKWALAGLVALALAAGVYRTFNARSAAKQTLQAQLQLQKQQTPVEIAVTDLLEARTLELTEVLALSGTLKAVNSALVKAKVAGDLQGLVVREGDRVKAGAVLGKVDTTESQARLRQVQQQADAALAQVEINQRTFDNNRALMERGFISSTALGTSQDALSAAQANYKAALAAVDIVRKVLDDAVLRAPISGQIAQRWVQNGERVGVDTRVVEIVDVSALEMEAAISAADSVRVQVGQSAALKVEGLEQALKARVVRINPSTVSGSRAVLIYLALENATGLRQGLFATGSLELEKISGLAVPLDSVRTDKPQAYVQQVVDGRVVHQAVRLGLAGDHEGTAMVAVSGLAEGAKLLAGATGALREGTPVRSRGDGP